MLSGLEERRLGHLEDVGDRGRRIDVVDLRKLLVVVDYGHRLVEEGLHALLDDHGIIIGPARSLGTFEAALLHDLLRDVVE